MTGNENENLYRSKVLMSNWFEDRSNHENPSHHHFKELIKGDIAATTISKEEFNTTSQNWLNFQAIPPSDTYQTNYKY